MGLIWITPHKRSEVRGYNASILQNPAVGSTFKTFFNLGVPVRKSGKKGQEHIFSFKDRNPTLNMERSNYEVAEIAGRMANKP